MNKIYDIVIIGAGPAGAVFAREISFSRPDLSVALIDGQSQSNKKPCGGLLAPDAQRVLAQFDLTLPKSVLADPQIFTVETIDLGARCTKYYQRHYLNMDRYRFDKWLISLIPERVEIIPSRAEDIIKNPENFTVILQNATITANYIIGADGANSIVRRKLYGKMPKHYISIQEWYENKGEKLPYYSCIFDKATSESCSWTIHKDGYVIYGGAFSKKNCKEAFEKQKKRLEDFKNAKFGSPIYREACLVSSPRGLSELVCGGSDRFYLLGEAAGFISASSFEGISCAILSAKLLAESFEKNDLPTEILKSYKKKTLSLRLKLFTKIIKRGILCNPILRKIIMKSGICTVRVK